MRLDLLMDALPVMGTGYLGIFIVTLVIIVVVSLLNKLGNKYETKPTELSVGFFLWKISLSCAIIPRQNFNERGTYESKGNWRDPAENPPGPQ